MKIIKVEKSFELCAEAGWYGYNVYFDEKAGEEFIRALAPIGELLYMDQLRAPFFRVQGPGYLIKGVQGNNHLRIGVENNDTQLLQELLKKLSRHPAAV